VVQGVLASATGPGGRDGYLHMDDARELLRLAEAEVSEIAVRLRDLADVPSVEAQLERELGGLRSPHVQPPFEVHGWEALTPFAHVARMIDLLDLFIRVMLLGIVVISVMNVMMMAVYERVREIGTVAAIGTPPARILALFLCEGLLHGLFGALIGATVSVALVYALNAWPITVAFGRGEFTLVPTLSTAEVLWVAGGVLVVAAVASLQPAWKAARMDPIAALRHV
jgi:putative ABC transport system permease protein